MNCMNFLDRWFTRMGAQILFDDYEINRPYKLRELHRRVAMCGYPEPATEVEKIAWEVYRERYGRPDR